MKPLLPVETRRGWLSVVFAGMLTAGMLTAGGCLRATPRASATRPTLLDPRWHEDAFAEHLDFFRGAFQDGATPASDRVADYVSAVMHEAWLQPALEDRYRLRSVFGRPSGYAGYVGGKHPPVAKEAVLVCADLEAAPDEAAPDEAAPDEAAALLEVARVYGIASQYTLMPERSVIFALWPRLAGQDDPLAGLRAYLRQPTWDLDRVRTVLYVGLPVRLRAEAQALLSEHGIALQRVSASPPRAAAVARARALAERTHWRLRAATLTGGEMMPALGDTLRVPHPQQR